MPEDEGRVCRMFASDDGQLYVHVGDLALFIQGFSEHLKDEGREDEANGAASVGVAFLAALTTSEIDNLTVME